MGTYRLLLAIAVVIGHSAAIPGLPILGAGLAVKLFFIVSGFYMGLILSEKYNELPRGTWLFFSNRFLRILPLFWLMLLLEGAWASITWLHNGLPPSMPVTLTKVLVDQQAWMTIFLLFFSQVTLIGTECWMLFSWTPDSGFFLHQSPILEATDSVRGWRFLLAPHSWTLSCELFFYFLAPWLNRRPTSQLVAMMLSFILLIATLPHWIDARLAEVATDFFAPLQIPFFLAGILAYRWYATDSLSRGLDWTLVATLGVFVLGFQLLSPLSHRASLWGLYIVASVALPSLFRLTSRNRRDRRIGDLSYPLYLIHLLPIALILQFADPLFLRTPWFPISAIFSSIVVAWGLTRLVEIPIDRYRQRRLDRTRS